MRELCLKKQILDISVVLGKDLRRSTVLYSTDGRETSENLRWKRDFFWQRLLIHQKLFDCVSHELLIAKLNACGFDKKPLNFISAYFENFVFN